MSITIDRADAAAALLGADPTSCAAGRESAIDVGVASSAAESLPTHESSDVDDERRGVLEALVATGERIARAQADRFMWGAAFAELYPCVTRASDGSGGSDGGAESAAAGGEGLSLCAEGCPAVAEFAALEMSARLGMRPETAACAIASALCVKYRLPQIWGRVDRLQMRVWQAEELAGITRELPLDLCLRLSAELGLWAGRLSWRRLRDHAQARVLEWGPGREASERDRLLGERRVQMWQGDHTTLVEATLGVADGRWLDSQLGRIARILAKAGDTDSLDVRRAKALGVLATPARALQLLQADMRGQATLLDHRSWGDGDRCPSGVSTRGPGAATRARGGSSGATERRDQHGPAGGSEPFQHAQRGDSDGDGDGHGDGDAHGHGDGDAHGYGDGESAADMSRSTTEWCALAGEVGHECGAITVDPDRLAPPAQIYIHLTDTANGDGIALPAHRCSTCSPTGGDSEAPPGCSCDAAGPGVGIQLDTRPESQSDAVLGCTCRGRSSGPPERHAPQGPPGSGAPQGRPGSGAPQGPPGSSAPQGPPGSGEFGAVAFVEGMGPRLVQWVRDLVGHSRVTVRPVLEPASVNASSAYGVPPLMREAVLLRNPTSVFPYSTRNARRCDIDHTVPFDPAGPAGQTRLGNLGPLGRKEHRAKTHGGWAVVQPWPGVFCWTSPLGYRYVVTPQVSLNLDDPGGAVADDLWASPTEGLDGAESAWHSTVMSGTTTLNEASPIDSETRDSGTRDPATRGSLTPSGRYGLPTAVSLPDGPVKRGSELGEDAWGSSAAMTEPTAGRAAADDDWWPWWIGLDLPESDIATFEREVEHGAALIG